MNRASTSARSGVRRLLTVIGVLCLSATFQLGLGQVAAAAAPATTTPLVSGSGTRYWNTTTTTWTPAASCTALGPWSVLSGSSYVADDPAACTWASPFADRYVTFRQTFTLPAGYSGASLQVSWYADNAAQVSLNGTRIGGNPDNAAVQASAPMYFQGPATTASATTGFRAGTNTLTFILHNWGTWGTPTQSGNNPYGLDFLGSVTFTAPPMTTAQCTNGGWRSYGIFKNQGDCVSFVASKGRNLPGD